MRRNHLRGQHTRAIAVVAGLSVALLALAGCSGKNTSEKLNGETKFKLPNAPTAALPAYGERLHGRMRPLRPIQGELMLVYFGYLSCPDVCPTTMSSLGVAVRSLTPAQRRQLEIGMVTGDPKRDSGADIVGYLGHFFRDLPVYGFRTADQAQLERVERAFGAASEIDPHKPGENYSVTHTAWLYAVDRSGEILVMWPFGSLSEEISADLKVLLKRQNRTSNS